MASFPAPYSPSPDTRRVYVSVTGSDAFSGLSETTPKRTIAAAVALLRDGYPDWLLLRRGDVFRESIGRWKKSGRSPTEPMVIWSYGTGAYPALFTGPETGFEISPGSSTPEVIRNLVLCGLNFEAHTRNPNSDAYIGPAGGLGVRVAHVCSDLIFDDCGFSFYTVNMSLEGYYKADWTTSLDPVKSRLDRVTVRYCRFFNAYNTTGHSQGLFTSRVYGLVTEDNIADHNGWGEQPDASDDPTIYNHNFYIQTTCWSDTKVRRNILCRAASHGVQLRCGGELTDNFLYRNPIGIQTGYAAAPPVDPNAKYLVARNVVLDGTDITPEPDKAGGWGIVMTRSAPTNVVDNIVAHCISTKGNRRSIERWDWATYSNNIVFDWTTPSTTRAVLPTSTGPFNDPDRGPENTGLFGSMALFLARLRTANRDDWVSAEALNAYIRVGFMTPTPTPVTTPVPAPDPPPVLAFELFAESADGVNAQRTKVPGGWLVLATLVDDGLRLPMALTFIPDPEHKWLS